MKRIFLCGATGHLGPHVLKQLGGAGYWVRALARLSQQAADLTGFAHEVHTADLLSPAALAGCCAGIDTVISTAGASVHLNTRGKQSFRDVDYAGNRNLLAEARRAGVRKFVYVSVLAPSALAHTAYVRAKEDFCRDLAASGLDCQILRPTVFFSALADLITMARRGPLPLVGDGTARTNPIDDEEVAAACVEAIESADRNRDLGGPDVFTRRQILDLVFHSLGRQPRYRRVPVPLARLAVPLIGLVNPRLRDLAEFNLAVARHDALAPARGTRSLAGYFTLLARYC